MNDKVYMVMGSTGEYGDRVEWPVRAFLSIFRAKDLVVAATARAREIEASRPSKYDRHQGLNEHDPDMRMHYTGTSYFIYEAPLEP